MMEIIREFWEKYYLVFLFGPFIGWASLYVEDIKRFIEKKKFEKKVKEKRKETNNDKGICIK